VTGRDSIAEREQPDGREAHLTLGWVCLPGLFPSRTTGSSARRDGPKDLGIIVLVAAIIVAIFALGIPSKIAGALGKAIDSIVNGNAG
jgi:hypothetical protein